MTNDDLEFTGERMIPGKVDSVLLMEHLARYRYALDYVSGKIILDAACGAGYGSYILSSKAESVLGIDISEHAIKYSSSVYNHHNIEFRIADILDLPFEDKSFDIIVAFEIFEHLHKPEKMLRELKRVSKERIILSTPNTEYAKSTLENVHHVKEYSLDEFSNIIRCVFKGEVEFIGQFPTSKMSSIKTAYMKAKRKLGVGPIFKKPIMNVANPQDLITIDILYEFKSAELKNAEFFISNIDLQTS